MSFSAAHLGINFAVRKGLNTDPSASPKQKSQGQRSANSEPAAKEGVDTAPQVMGILEGSILTPSS